MKKALIIIDMQIMPFIWKDYGGKLLYRENLLLEKTKSLIAKARASKSPIFYILYTEKGDSPRALSQPLWQIHPEIAVADDDIEIVKYHADSFLETDLELHLKKRNINNLVLCGVQTEYCIDTTVRAAFSHGYSVELVTDAHSTYDSKQLSAEQIISYHNEILSQFCFADIADNIVF